MTELLQRPAPLSIPRIRASAAHQGASPSRTTPTDPRLADLGLADLRAYRQRLREEEDRASYWRRLVHARLDLLRSGRGTDGSVALEDLVRILGDTASGAARRSLLRVRAEADLPQLPDLVEVWSTPGDADLDDVEARLCDAEVRLTDYRAALFARLGETTRALVLRYRQDPLAALAVLR